jgi:excisionase family DNA binding protein
MIGQAELTVSVPEAAKLLGISRAHAYELVARNELPAVRLGRRLLIPRQVIESLLRQAAATASTKPNRARTSSRRACS